MRTAISLSMCCLISLLTACGARDAADDPPSGVSLLSRAQAARVEQEHERADVLFSRALISGTLMPSQAFEAYYGRALTRRSISDFDRAVFDFIAAIRLQPNSPVVPYDLLNTMVLRDAHAARTGVVSGSMAVLDDLVRSNPEAPWAYRLRALKQWMTGNFASALADFNKAIELGIPDAVLYRERGNIHLSLRNYKEAAADFAQALDFLMETPHDA